MATANVSISIRRANGVEVNASGNVPDELIAETAGMLSAMLFEQSLLPIAEDAADPSQAPAAVAPVSPYIEQPA